MGLPVRARHLPARIASGAFILNSGLGKRNADEQTAAGVYGMAKGAYPFLGSLEAKQFVKLLSAGEITLGAALLMPVIPTFLAGAGLAAFAGGLVGMYVRTPALRQPGSLRPSQQGIGIAKDTWLLAIGVGFILDDIADRSARAR